MFKINRFKKMILVLFLVAMGAGCDDNKPNVPVVPGGDGQGSGNGQDGKNGNGKSNANGFGSTTNSNNSLTSEQKQQLDQINIPPAVKNQFKDMDLKFLEEILGSVDSAEKVALFLDVILSKKFLDLKNNKNPNCVLKSNGVEIEEVNPYNDMVAGIGFNNEISLKGNDCPADIYLQIKSDFKGAAFEISFDITVLLRDSDLKDQIDVQEFAIKGKGTGLADRVNHHLVLNAHIESGFNSKKFDKISRVINLDVEAVNDSGTVKVASEYASSKGQLKGKLDFDMNIINDAPKTLNIIFNGQSFSGKAAQGPLAQLGFDGLLGGQIISIVITKLSDLVKK